MFQDLFKRFFFKRRNIFVLKMWAYKFIKTNTFYAGKTVYHKYKTVIQQLSYKNY